MTPLLGQPLSQLTGRRRLARTLQPEQEDDPRPLRRRLEAAVRVAEERHHLVADDLDHLLRRREAAENILPHGTVANTVDERLDDLEVDVGFEQREANLAQRGLDVLFRQPPLAAERLENVLEATAEGIKHEVSRRAREAKPF